MKPEPSERPSWDRLYDIAAAQGGLFTTRQAGAAGYSTQLLWHHLEAGRVERVRRGVYRLVHFPVGEHEDLVATWLWSEHTGVFSHATALSLHGISDILPAHHDLTLPASWHGRRLRVPNGTTIHFANIGSDERTWFGPVPVTTVPRTLEDCARQHLSPDLLEQAAQQALRRGLVTRTQISEVEAALAPFGGIELAAHRSKGRPLT
jgi:predicted transcriptional regulator of viral defense system